METPQTSSAYGRLKARSALLTGSHRWEWYKMALEMLPTLITVVIAVFHINDENKSSSEVTTAFSQAAKFINGQRNYAELHGPNGEPAQHPAGNMYLSVWLYYLTGGGEDLRLPRVVFNCLYIASPILVLFSYRYIKFGFFVHVQLGFSGQLFLIYNWFWTNDCFAVFFLWLAILSYQRGSWTAGSFAFSLALGVSSYMILVLPALAVILLFSHGASKASKHFIMIALVQVVLAYPFTTTSSNMWGYLAGVYHPINWFRGNSDQSISIWCWLPENWYNSPLFSVLLFVCYVASLASFVAYPWMKPIRKSLPAILRGSGSGSNLKAVIEESKTATVKVDPGYIAETMLSAVALPFLFSLELPEASYVYVAWAMPVLLQGALGTPGAAWLLWLQHLEWARFPKDGTLGAVKLAVFHCFPLVVSLVKGYDAGSDDKSPENQVAQGEKVRPVEPEVRV